MRAPHLQSIAALLACLLAVTACESMDVRTLEHDRDTRQLTDDEARRWYAADELDEIWQQKGLIYEDDELTGYVQSIAGALYPEFSGTVVLRVLDSPDLNAFALPNGSVYLNLGLIARMENEAQLATVVAHEISHFKLQHGLKQRHTTESAVIAGWAVTILTGIPLSGQLIALGAMSGYSQDAEREADQEGFKRMVERGYDPAAAVKVFQIMLQEAEVLDSKEPWLYSSHPRLTERIETMQALSAQQGTTGGITQRERFAMMTTSLSSSLLEKYLVAHKYKQLIHLLEADALRQRYPVHAEFYLGEAYHQRGEKGDQEKAQVAYLEAIDKSPGFAPSYRALGIMRMQQGKKAEALIYFENYLKLDPDAGDRKYIQLYRSRLLEES